MGPAERAAATTPDARIVRAQLAHWIVSARTVYADAAAQRVLMRDEYALLNANAPSQEFINTYMREHNPFERGQTETVDVQVHSVLPVGAGSTTYRAEWTEVVRGRDGKVVTTTPWQANLTVAVAPPKDEKTLFVNPLGLYVNDVSWAERQL